MKKYNFILILPCLLLTFISFTFLAHKNQVKSAPVTNLKDQLSNAQLSYFARLVSGNGSIINIATSGNPSNSTANLFVGDTLAIANAGVTTVSIYTIKDVTDLDSIELSTSIGTTTTNSYIVATRSAIHSVTFTPQSSTTGEKWQFLIKATNRTGELSNDGIPDQTGFDLGTLTAGAVTCPLSHTASVGTTTIISSGVGLGYTGVYHVIECSGGSTSTVGTSIAMVIGAGSSQMINPSPYTTHTIGQADTYTYAIRQMVGSSIVDTTFGKIANTESVRVTAIVEPTLTFTVSANGTTTVGTSRCGTALSNGAPDTTATSVSFGPIILNQPNNLAQKLDCITNGNGYVVKAFVNKAMTMLGTATTIPNTNCNGTGCTTTSATTWTTYTNSGFGYSLESASGTPTLAFTTGSYKPFGVGYANAQTIFSKVSTPTTTDSVYVCYRVTASTTQQAGTYENSVSYIATATF